jgi:NAD(P)-dependent dehydrogenase (short-subunit alcohol dehydrogenase family)
MTLLTDVSEALIAEASRASIDVMQRVLRTSFLGAVAVAHAVLPLLRKSDAGRIVNASSDLGPITRHEDATWKAPPLDPWLVRRWGPFRRRSRPRCP